MIKVALPDGRSPDALRCDGVVAITITVIIVDSPYTSVKFFVGRRYNAGAFGDSLVVRDCSMAKRVPTGCSQIFAISSTSVRAASRHRSCQARQGFKDMPGQTPHCFFIMFCAIVVT